jgi:hypothetical protein
MQASGFPALFAFWGLPCETGHRQIREAVVTSRPAGWQPLQSGSKRFQHIHDDARRIAAPVG